MNYENRIIDYLEGNSLALGLVVRQQKDKLQVMEPGGRSAKIAEKQIVVVHGNAESANFASQAEAVQAAIVAQQDDLDLELLWEGVSSATSVEYSLKELAQEYFSSSEAVAQSAIGRVLLDDKIYFKRKGLAFAPRTAAEVQSMQLKQRREIERAERRDAALAWTRLVLSGKASGAAIPAEQADFLRSVEAMMFQCHSNEATAILDQAANRRSAREVGLELLQRLDRLPADCDPFLLLHGVTVGFSDNLEKHAAAVAPYQPQAHRADFSTALSFSIDDTDTREIDDAISVEALPDGKVRVGIHIADPSVFIHKDDPIDQTARDRPLSLYLPTTTVTMMPERIGCDLASLNAAELRPCLSFCLEIDPKTNQIERQELCRAQLRVGHRLSYDQTDALLESDASSELAQALQICHKLAISLHANRLQAGALELLRPELKVQVRDNQISVKLLPAQTPSRRLVSELMIQANRMAAEHALSKDVPVIYRLQPPPANAVNVMTEYDPVTFDRTVRQLQRTRLSTFPQRHSALGLDVYTQVSSPIRRYTDLVMQRQLAAHLEGVDYPYGADELIEVLGAVDRVEAENRRLERDATSFWVLEYLRRHCQEQVLAATVISSGQGGPVAELDQYLVRGAVADGNGLKPGARISVAIAEVQPKKALLVLKTQ